MTKDFTTLFDDGEPPQHLTFPLTPSPLAVDSTIRGKKFLFRCSTRQDLQMWLNGLADLTP